MVERHEPGPGRCTDPHLLRGSDQYAHRPGATLGEQLGLSPDRFSASCMKGAPLRRVLREFVSWVLSSSVDVPLPPGRAGCRKRRAAAPPGGHQTRVCRSFGIGQIEVMRSAAAVILPPVGIRAQCDQSAGRGRP